MDIGRELRELARNLYWTWQPSVIAIFRDIDAALWRRVNHNPVAFLSEIPPERVRERALELASESRINFAFHRLTEHLEWGPVWGNVASSPLAVNPIAYFSAEFGLHESIPIYSGGLGILAGDFLKSASDLGIPVVGVGLLYAEGYFNQRLNSDGWQEESYFETPLEKLPLERVTGPAGQVRTVAVETHSGRIETALWVARVGRSRLVLLDSDLEVNKPEDRELTARLYGGNETERVRQELLLGVGGMRALAALGIKPSVIHLNEGHSAFSVLEAAREEMLRDGVGFAEAHGRVMNRTIFTTHTPVEAGHDRFEEGLIEHTLGPLRESLGLSLHDLMALGRVDPQNKKERFCMTVLGLKSAWKSNAVSFLHGQVTRRMWQPLWPNRPSTEVPIGHISNGVHVASWLAPPIKQLFDSCLGQDWERRMTEASTWKPIAQLNNEELWEAHQITKARLITYVHRRVCAQEARRTGRGEVCDITMKRLDPGVLTIGFARRFATYKRGDLWLRDEDRLARLVCSAQRPIQFVVAGKAHPRDDGGKQLIQRIYRMSMDPRFMGRIAFVEDYDINVARHLIQGVDLWLNTPRRPLEACGTSGMKALFNGVLNCSVLDGWWAEAYNGSNGFAIGGGEQHADPAVQDDRDAKALYEVLENEVIPLYYDRDKAGVPRRWVARIKEALLSLAWRFNADRMVIAYAKTCYLPVVGGETSIEAGIW